ncbi:hypothetical protein Pcinc_023130 [Petrolisthes cinctipes]|uniref:Hexosyltransferase n=1 Tax=Petrolisthes cinctipes TaxID=88211 RepID=A0AAE1FD66_PETCI|nr:hypothetical protein Pcinc_023130 [Petrolisthes cinctipes]
MILSKRPLGRLLLGALFLFLTLKLVYDLVTLRSNVPTPLYPMQQQHLPQGEGHEVSWGAKCEVLGNRAKEHSQRKGNITTKIELEATVKTIVEDQGNTGVIEDVAKRKETKIRVGGEKNIKNDAVQHPEDTGKTSRQKYTQPSPTFIPDQPDTSPLGCPPDIPKRFLIEEADYCHQRPGLQIIAYVHSSIDRVSQRNLTRTTWATASAYDMGQNSVNIGVVFMVGRAKNSHQRQIIQEESQRYHDIVQGDYGDHYRLLTYKGLAGLYWISRHCAHVPWTLHSDDDTHIDIFLYHRALKELDDEAKKMFICSHMYGPVLRSGRWKVRYEEYPQDKYPLYCSGGVWFLQTKLVPKLLEASKSVPFLWVDDAYITGVLAQKARLKQFPFQKYYGKPEPKLEKLGKEVAWFVKSVPRWVWWNEIVKYHRKYSMHNPATLFPHGNHVR